ncbi:MAG: hypothetical protein ACTSVZ_09360 [Promethearchaeota archaeon]
MEVFTPEPPALPVPTWNPVHFQSNDGVFNSINANEIGATTINSPNVNVKTPALYQNSSLISFGTPQHPKSGVFEPAEDIEIVNFLDDHIFPVKFTGDSDTVRKDFILGILPSQNFHCDLWINLKDVSDGQEMQVLFTTETGTPEYGIKFQGSLDDGIEIITGNVVRDGDNYEIPNSFQKKWIPLGFRYISGATTEESGIAFFLNFLPLFGGKISGFTETDPVSENTLVTCPSHGLQSGDRVIISSSQYYDGLWIITCVNDDQFSIPTELIPFTDNYTAICSKLFAITPTTLVSNLIIGLKGANGISVIAYVDGIGFSHMNGYTPFSNSSKGLGMLKVDALEVDSDSNYKGALGVLGKNWAVNAAGIVDDFIAANCTIIEEFNGHKNVCSLQQSGDIGQLEYYHDSLQKFGVFGLFFCYSDISDSTGHFAKVKLKQTELIALELLFENGLIKYKSGEETYQTISSYSAGHLLYLLIDYHATGIKVHINGMAVATIPVLDSIAEINGISISASGNSPAYVDSVGISWLGFTSYRNITAGGGNFKGVFADEGVIKTLTTKHQIINAHGNFKISPHVLGKTWSQNTLNQDGSFDIFDGDSAFENWTEESLFETAQIQYIKGNHKFVMFLRNVDGTTASSLRTSLPDVDHTNFSFATWAWLVIETGGSVKIRLLDENENLIHFFSINEVNGEKQILFTNYLGISFFVGVIPDEWSHLEFQITLDAINIYSETNLIFEGSITSRPFSILEIQLADASLWLDAPALSNLAYVPKSFENFADGIQTSKYQSAEFQRVINIQADNIKSEKLDWETGTFRTLLPKTALFNPNTPENVQNIQDVQIWEEYETGGTVYHEDGWKGIPTVCNIAKELSSTPLGLTTTFTSPITDDNGCSLLIYIKESNEHLIQFQLGSAIQVEIENLDLFWIGPDDERIKLTHVSPNQWIHLAITWNFELRYASVFLNTKLIGGNLDWFDGTITNIDQWLIIAQCFESGYSLYLAAPIAPVLGSYNIEDLWNNFSGSILPTQIGNEDQRIHSINANQIDARSYLGTFDGEIAVRHDRSFPKYTFEEDEIGLFATNSRFITSPDPELVEIVTDGTNKCLHIRNMNDVNNRQAYCIDNFGKEFGMAMIKGTVKFKIKISSDIVYFYIRDSKNVILVDLLTNSGTLRTAGNSQIGYAQKIGVYSFVYGNWYTMEFEFDTNLGYTLHITDAADETTTFGENYSLPLRQSGNGRATNVKFATEYSPYTGNYYIDDLEYKFSEFHLIPQSCSTVNESLYHLDQAIKAHHWLTNSKVIKIPEGTVDDAYEWNIGKYSSTTLRGIYIKVLGHNLRLVKSIKLGVGTSRYSISKTFLFDLLDCNDDASLKQWTALFCPIENLSAMLSNYIYLWKDGGDTLWDGEVYFMEVVPLPSSDGLSSIYSVIEHTHASLYAALEHTHSQIFVGGTLTQDLIANEDIVAKKGVFGAVSGAPDVPIWQISQQYPNYGLFFNEGSPDYIEFKEGGTVRLKIGLNGYIYAPRSAVAFTWHNLGGLGAGYIYSSGSYVGLKAAALSNTTSNYFLMHKTDGAYTYINAATYIQSRIGNVTKFQVNSTNITSNSHKTIDMGTSTLAWDDMNADNFYNRGPAHNPKSYEEVYIEFSKMQLKPHGTEKTSVDMDELDLSEFPDEIVCRERAKRQYIRKTIPNTIKSLRKLGYSESFLEFDKIKQFLKIYPDYDSIPEELKSSFAPDPDICENQELGVSLNQWLVNLTMAFKYSQEKILSLENEVASLQNEIALIKQAIGI